MTTDIRELIESFAPSRDRAVLYEQLNELADDIEAALEGPA